VSDTNARTFFELRAKLPAGPILERVNELVGQALAYVWGWQDAKNDAKDSGQASEFAYAYGVARARVDLGQASSCPAIHEAWKSWMAHREIRDYNGRALNA
jgi:hypothetical protein